MPGHQGAFARHLLGVDLADAVHAVGLGLGQLLAGVGLAVGFDAAGLGIALGGLDTRNLFRFGFELALLDLALLEGQHVLHGLFLRLRGNHLLAGRGFGRHFAAHLVGVGVQLGFTHALVFQLQRVAHFFGRQLFGQQAVHAPAVFGGQIHLADLDAAQRDAIGRQAGTQLGFDDLRNLRTLGREDFTHGVAGKHLVDQALHSGLDDVGAYVVGQVACFDGGRVGVQGVAHAQIQPQRQALHRLQWRTAGGLAHGFGAVALVTQREHAHRVQAGHHPHAAVAPQAHRTGELVQTHTQVALRQVLHGRIAVHHQARCSHHDTSGHPAHGAGGGQQVGPVQWGYRHGGTRGG